MKTSSLPVISFLAAVAALVLLPVSAPAAALAVTATGIVSLLAADYGSTVGRPRLAAPVTFRERSRPGLAACPAAA